MGFPEAVCAKDVLFSDADNVEMFARCQKTTEIRKISHSGLLHKDSRNLVSRCQIDSNPKDLEIQAHFDQPAFEAAFNATCYGKEYCQPIINADIFMR